MSLNPNNDVMIRLGAESPELESVLQQTAASIEAALKKIESGFESLERQTKQNTKDIVGAIKGLERDTQKSVKNITGIVGGAKTVFKGLFAALAVGTAARYIGELIEISDKYTELNSQLKLVTSSEEELLTVREELYEITKDTRGDLGSTIELYTRMARSTQELDISQEDLLEVTKAINQALIVSGASGESAKAAIIQLSQGMASGTLRGEELNSVLEQTPRLAEMIAEGMGISYGEIRKFAQEGKITTEVIIEAIKNQSKVVDEEFSKMTATVSQAKSYFSTVYETIISKANDSSGATNDLAQAIIDLADTLEENEDNIITSVTTILNGIAWLFNAIGETATAARITIAQLALEGEGKIEKGAVSRMLFDEDYTDAEVLKILDMIRNGLTEEAAKIMITGPKVDSAYGPSEFEGLEFNPDGTLKNPPWEEESGGGGDGSVEQWRQALNDRRIYYDEENKLRRMSLADEVAYWENILQTQKMSVKDRERVEKILSQTRLRMKSQELKQQEALSAMEIDSVEDAAMHELDIERQTSKQKYDLGQISLSQYQQQLLNFENKRYQIALEAQQRRIELAKLGPDDPVQAQKNLDKLLEIYRKHQRNVQDINIGILKTQQKQMKALTTDLSQGIGNALGQFMTGMSTFSDFLKNLYQGIQNAFAQMLGKIVADWIHGQLQMLFFKQTTNAGMIASDAAASAGTIATKTAEATTVVGANAAEAASGAAASQAAIPIAGPGLAAAAFAATMALVMGAMNLFSAEGGYDIPAGVNPLTQLHAREMVLPATYADLIRGMANTNDGRKAGSGDTHIHVSAVDARSVRKLFEREGGALYDSLKTQIRRFKR